MLDAASKLLNSKMEQNLKHVEKVLDSWVLVFYFYYFLKKKIHTQEGTPIINIQLNK